MPADQTTAPANRELAARIVAAYVRRNQIGSDQMPALISTVHQALAGLGQPEPKYVGPRTPAVSVRQSVRPDYLVCLECGRRSKMLRRHLADAHGLSTDEYRKRWNLRSDYPMVAPAYSERRSGLAKQFGLGRGRRKSAASDTASEPQTATTSQRLRGTNATNQRVKVHGRDFSPCRRLTPRPHPEGESPVSS